MIKKKFIVQVVATIVLLLLLVVNIASPISAFAVNYSASLGTNQALGSPLLNERFSYDDWNKWELVTFGIFLSNLTNPLVDSYRTAFTVNNKGSAGAGKAALEFGSGSDSVGNEALANMLDYAVKNQATSTGKTLKAKYFDVRADGTKDVSEKEATIKDLLIYVADGVTMTWDFGNGKFFDGGPCIQKMYTDIEINSNGIGDYGYKAYVLEEAYLCRLVVEGSEGQDEIVFDWSNGWDAQMMAMWMASVVKGDYAEQAMENFQGMIDADSKLFLDAFGNICTNYDGENIVIIPAASNCHIYKNGTKYNLLNSVILSEAYTDATGESLIQGIEAYGWGSGGGWEAGNPLKSLGGLEAGDVVIYFDSDTGIFDGLQKNREQILSGSISSDVNVTMGAQYLKLLNSTLTEEQTANALGFRMEVVGGERVNEDGEFGKIDLWQNSDQLSGSCENIVRSANILSRVYSTTAGKETLVELTTEKGKAPLFDSYVYVPVNTWSDDKAEKTIFRSIINSAFKYLDGTTAAASGKIRMTNSSSLRGDMPQLKTSAQVARWLFFADFGTLGVDSDFGEREEVSKFVKNAMLGSSSKYFKLPSNAADILSTDIRWNDLQNKGIEMQGGTGLFWADHNPNNIASIAESDLTDTSSLDRVLKVYMKNENMKNAMNVLNVREGTEFSVWTHRVYLTYLDWFGVISGENQFNEALFDASSDVLNVDAEELFEGTFMTAEEKEAEVLDYTYMILHPTKGREYRADLIMDWISDWMYNTYQNIVYGNSTTSYSSTYSGGTRTAAGFLHMQSYQDNFMTSWFMEGYAKYAIIIIGIMLVAIVVVGVINHKSFAWSIVSIILMVNIVLVTPMLGESTPYIANNIVQAMFSNKMTYWAMSESISNAKIERDLDITTDSSDSGLTTSDYIRMLNVVYLDRAIMMRTDISKKVTEDSTGILAEVQALPSARWLLPTLMRQFSASDKSADYVYQSLGDVYDNWSNMYWVYNPDDKLSVQTANAQTVQDYDEASVPSLDISSKVGRYEGYKDTSAQMRIDDSDTFGTEDDGSGEAKYLSYPWQSTSRLKDDADVYHAGFYLIPELTVPNANGNWDQYVQDMMIDAESLRDKSVEMEREASSYDPSGAGATPNMGYLWTTENLGYYFYGVVKDTFGSSKTLASFSGDLQGTYKMSSVTGEEERQSFMHYQDTGLIRDFLDMEEVFTNVIPYMYSVQLLAGDEDGTSGILGDTKMTNYDLYSENTKAWLFRCNWVTKLLEDKDLTRPCNVGDGKGGVLRVENPMLASSYEEAGREMVFSEAQMVSQGLNEADLSLVELKILDVNREVERAWTLLINYINAEDITTEVFYRQMATEALIAFDKEFSPDRIVNASKALYPTSLDLRSISFDSVMKMLMINSTRDSSYVYGDTMAGVIENSDFISATLLLLSSFLCALIIPLIRNVVLGLIFYLGLWAMVCNILAGGITKLKITTAYCINNTVYLLITFVYYGVFALMINVNTADSVLSVGNVVVDSGPPTWQFCIILIASGVYIWASFRLMSFTVKNFRDLGFEVYAAWGSMLASKLSKGITAVKNKIGFGSSSSTTTTAQSVGGNSKDTPGTGTNAPKPNATTASRGNGVVITNKDPIPVTIVNGKGNVGPTDGSSVTEELKGEMPSGYQLDQVADNSTKKNENFYDKQVEKGSHIKDSNKPKNDSTTIHVGEKTGGQRNG